LISQVHDELIVDAAVDEVQMVKQILKDTMENVLKLDVPLKVNIAVGRTWAEAK
jgi:DNA polymerase-1